MPKALARKVGPLPVWGWMLGVGILAMVVVLLRRPEPKEADETPDATDVDAVPTFPRAAINDSAANLPASYDPPDVVAQAPPTATELVRLRAELATAIAQRSAVKTKIDATQAALKKDGLSAARRAELKARLARYLKHYASLTETINALRRKIAGLSAISDRATGGRAWKPPSLPGIGTFARSFAAHPSNSSVPLTRRPSVIEIPTLPEPAQATARTRSRQARPPTIIETDRRRRVMPYIPAGR